MNHRERVIAELKREPVDRVPIFMWFHPCTADHLAEVLEIPARYVGEAMGNDVLQTWVNNNYAMEGITHANDGEWHVDYWGIKWVRRYFFNQIEVFPLAGKTREEVLAYPFPEEYIPALLGQMDRVVADRRDFFLGCDISPCAFEMYCRLRGMQDALIDIVDDLELAYTLLGCCADFSITLGQQACQKFNLDWLWTGDDIASQQGMMMSPRTWRELIKPHLARVFALGKSYGLPVVYHCCGALRPIIPDLIEIGMDILNPVQSICPGMDPFELKAEFGSQITFMGGLDTQVVFPFASPDEVRRFTADLLERMTCDGGGYILAASHTIPPETPDENIFAMYDEAGVSREEIFDHAAEIRLRLNNIPPS